MYLRWQPRGYGKRLQLDISICESVREPGRRTPRRRVVCYIGPVIPGDTVPYRRRDFWEKAGHRLVQAEVQGRITFEQSQQFRSDLVQAIPPKTFEARSTPHSRRACPSGWSSCSSAAARDSSSLVPSSTTS